MNKTNVFNVDGIMCPMCVQALDKFLSGVDGIGEVLVSDDFKQVTVNYDVNILSATEIVSKIESVPDKDFKVIDVSEV